MGSFLLCYTRWSAARASAGAAGLRRAVVRWLVVCVVILHGVGAHAQAASIAHMEVERNDDGLFVNASMEFSLPSLVQEALQQGIPMTFMAEAEVTRPRWYWSDEKVATVQRFYRLSYQPLTQRWRLSVSSAPFSASGLGVSVGQSYDQLSEVLGVMQRIARWNVADAPALDPDAKYRVQLRFQLDMSQLPRPLQIGALGRSGWSLAIARTERVPALATP